MYYYSAFAPCPELHASSLERHKKLMYYLHIAMAILHTTMYSFTNERTFASKQNMLVQTLRLSNKCRNSGIYTLTLKAHEFGNGSQNMRYENMRYETMYHFRGWKHKKILICTIKGVIFLLNIYVFLNSILNNVRYTYTNDFLIWYDPLL